MIAKALALAAAGVAVLAVAAPAMAATTHRTVAAAPVTAHLTVNLAGSYASARSAGFTVFDVAGSATHPGTVTAKLDALPAGSRAMVWVGNLGNTVTTGFTRAQFQAQVNVLKNDSRVFGYFIADEPHPAKQPSSVGEIRARADYLHTVAPGQKSFIVVLDGTNTCGATYGCEYAALAPAHTHVDLVGIDSYPCHLGAPCEYSAITDRVNAAVRVGVPRASIVPVYQAFGQEGKASNPWYRTPTPAELRTMLTVWKAAVPSPILDYAYSWGAQTTSPQALSNHPELQSVVKTHNSGG